MYEENSLVGKVLNERYEILEVVGSGGMATVYKAECKLLNRYVAVKVLKDSLRYDLDLKEKFNREAQAAAKLSHNNIVSIFDVGEIEGLNYIVMEYIDGITLKEYISKNKPLNWMVARNIAIQIGLALEHAHANGIIHRDIKPQNILITKDNIIKVADFGIASVVTSETIVAEKNDSPMGSVQYISPEQARGGFVNETTDIYALGVIMYEMVTGQLPFDGDNPVSIAIKKIEKEPVNCKVINLDIPHDMAEVIMRAIAKDSTARFQTAQELIVALKRLNKQTSNAVIGRENVKQPAEEDIKKEEPETEETENISKKKKKAKKSKNGKEEPSLFNKVIISTIIGVLIVIALIAVGVFSALNGCGTKEITVPELTGLTLQEAEKKAGESGFTINKDNIEYRASEDGEVNTIIEQEPKGGSTKKNKKENKVITKLVICVDEVKVPDLVGLTLEKAEEKADEEGFKLEVEYETSDKVKKGEIISQTPEADETILDVEEKKVIKVIISKGGEEGDIEVTDVVGWDKEDAVDELQGLGLKVKVKEVEDNNAEVGEVIRQTPEAGELLSKNDTVTLYVCKGKKEEERKSIPSVIGLSRESAKKKLEDSGFKLGNVEEKESEKTEGEVISQSPAANSESPAGTSVNIVISKGKKAEEPQNENKNDGQTQTEAPSSTEPSNNNSSSSNNAVTEPEVKPQIKTITIPLPQDGEDEVTVKVVANGKVIHNTKHNKSEGKVDIKVEAKKDANVQVYFDDVMVEEKTVKFN